MSDPTPETSRDTLRLDIWLHRTRLFKTRALAAKMISKGRVRVGRAGRTTRVTKPHFKIAPGDGVALVRDGELFAVEVLALPERRGPFAEASACYSHIPTEPLSNEPGAEPRRTSPD